MRARGPQGPPAGLGDAGPGGQGSSRRRARIRGPAALRPLPKPQWPHPCLPAPSQPRPQRRPLPQLPPPSDPAAACGPSALVAASGNRNSVCWQ